MVRVFLCPPRSGGTLLNRCLSVLPNTIVLSEVNPRGGGWGLEGENSYTTIASQAKNWHGIDVTGDTFLEQSISLSEYARNQDLKLIFRDWSYPDFFGEIPTFQFSILKELKKVNSPIKGVVLVRNPIDVWISTGMPNLKDFCVGMAAFYAESKRTGFPIYKYESFCLNPEDTLKNICDDIEINYDDNFVNKFSTYQKVNGDIQTNAISRFKFERSIQPPKRKDINLYRALLLVCSARMKATCREFGYSSNYFSSGSSLKGVLSVSIRTLFRKLRI